MTIYSPTALQSDARDVHGCPGRPGRPFSFAPEWEAKAAIERVSQLCGDWARVTNCRHLFNQMFSMTKRRKTKGRRKSEIRKGRWRRRTLGRERILGRGSILWRGRRLEREIVGEVEEIE